MPVLPLTTQNYFNLLYCDWDWGLVVLEVGLGVNLLTFPVPFPAPAPAVAVSLPLFVFACTDVDVPVVDTFYPFFLNFLSKIVLLLPSPEERLRLSSMLEWDEEESGGSPRASLGMAPRGPPPTDPTAAFLGDNLDFVAVEEMDVCFFKPVDQLAVLVVLVG